MSLPENFERMTYEEIHEWAQQTYLLKAPVEKFKMKFKLSEDGWIEVKQRLDWNIDQNHIQSLCGDNPFCYLDHYHHYLMSHNETTNYLYNGTTEIAQVIADGFQNNFWYGVNMDVLTETMEILAELILIPFGG